jgi:phosphoglycolate phosphatase
MPYRAVIFDLDGTLLDTLDDLADSMNTVLQEHQFPTHPVEAFKTFVGDGVEMLVRRSLPEDRRQDPLLIEECVARMRETYANNWANKTRPYDGVIEMLTELNRRELPTAILSNKPDDFTKLCVGRFLGQVDFAVVQGADERTPHKPDPTGARRVADEMNTDPPACLYVGDTNTDMQTANNAGLFAVGCTWGFRSADELKQYGAKTLIDHPRELIDLL